MAISKKDRRILQMLQEDARTPYSEIARAVRMSENGVRYRLEKMAREGVIESYTVLLNPRMAGKDIMAIFNLDFERESLDETVSRLREMGELEKLYHTTGRYPILAIGLFDSNDALDEFINKRLLRLPVTKHEVNIVIKQHKERVYSV